MDTGARVTAGQAAGDALSLTDLMRLWPGVQAQSQESAGAAYATWLAPLQPMFLAQSDSGGPARLELAAQTQFIRDRVLREHLPLLESAVLAVTGARVSIGLTVAPGFTPPAPVKAVPLPPTVQAPEVTMPPLDGGERKEEKKWLDASTLDERYTFDTYVMGPSNQFAFAAAKRVAEEKTAVFNPFFLHGGVGLGKTHLMQAIGWELRQAKPDIRILYLSAEQFFMRFIRAIQDKDQFNFKHLCRGADVLMVDDIQFIAGKNSTQEEFFHTFNELVTQGKKVIMTADKSPHELANMEERLKSRLGSGLTVEIHVPEAETRLAILQKKAEERDLTLAPEVLQFLAQHIQSNVRELEGALNRLLAFSRLTGSAITVDFARDQLRDLLRVQLRTVTVDDIQQTVAEVTNQRLADLMGPRRTKDLAEARQVAMWLCKQLTTRSYPDIGRAFGGRDHTTVMHAVKQIEERKKTDLTLGETLRVLEGRLRGR